MMQDDTICQGNGGYPDCRGGGVAGLAAAAAPSQSQLRQMAGSAHDTQRCIFSYWRDTTEGRHDGRSEPGRSTTGAEV